MTAQSTPIPGSKDGRRPFVVIAWVLGSSLIWAAVVLSTGDTGWPLVVWALSTFAPLAWRNQARKDTP